MTPERFARAEQRNEHQLRRKMDALMDAEELRQLSDIIDRHNMNKPMSQLTYPHCFASGVAYRDEESSDHPGVFTCGECEKTYYA